MKNLVSRNPVQRFKQGRKIIKAEEGAIARWQRRIKSGINGIGSAFKGAFDMTFNPNNTQFGSQKIYNFTRTVPSRIMNSLVVENYTPENGGTINNKIRQSKQNKQKSNSNISNINYSNQYAGSSVRNYSQQPKKTTYVVNKTSPVKTSVSNNSFKLAFDTARNSGEQEFTWNGKRFNTMKAGETKEQWLAGLKPQTTTSSTITFEKPTSVLYTPKPIDNIKIENIPAQIGTYDRTQVRDYIRSKGFNPYSFNGAQRRALRMVLNGTANENDKLLVKGMNLFKQGGQLPSKTL